jgi:putative glutamine amidotransferase
MIQLYAWLVGDENLPIAHISGILACGGCGASPKKSGAVFQIGISYHGGTKSYDNYGAALHRAAQAEGLEVRLVWLAGHNSEPDGTIALVDGLCFTGGADVDPATYGRSDAASLCEIDRRRDRIERLLIESWREHLIPMLAICRGEQLLNVLEGGTLIPDLGSFNAVHRGDSEEGGDRRHPVAIVPGSLLAHIAGGVTGEVNSSHHQAVDRIARTMAVNATAPDGTIEAFERRDPADQPFLLAVQWHPERMRLEEPLGGDVLRAFVRAAAAWRTRSATRAG